MINLTTRAAKLREAARQERLRMSQARAMVAPLRREFQRFGAAVASAVSATGTVPGMAKLEADHRGRIAALIRAAWRRAADTSVADLRDAAKSGGFIERKDALGDILRRIVDKIALNRATEIAATSVRKIREVIKRIVSADDAPLGQAALGKQIREQADELSVARANLVARTESHAALQTSQVETIKEMDLPNQRKEWVATMDHRTREDHQDVNGKTLPMDGKFSVGFSKLDHPGDPNATGIDAAAQTINCRCVLVFSAGRHKPRSMFD